MSRGRGRATWGIPRCGEVGAGSALGCMGLAAGAHCTPKPPCVLLACPPWQLIPGTGGVALDWHIWAYFWFIIHPMGLGAGVIPP